MKNINSIRIFAVLMLFTFNAFASAQTMSSRAISLSNMGLTETVVLKGQNAEQHFYLPIPQGIPFNSARIELSGVYSQPFSEPSSLTISVGGKPLLVRKLNETMHSIEIVLPLKEVHPRDGLLDIGVSLNSRIAVDPCYDQRGKGVELAIDTRRTRLVYAFENNEIQDLRSMVSSLPRRPTILLPSNILSLSQYEAALHLILALKGMGLEPEIISIPQVGDSVDMQNIPVSARLPGTFKNASQKSSLYVLKTKSEVAAWLSARIASPNGLAQLVIDPETTRQGLMAAFVESEIKSLPEKFGKPDKWLVKNPGMKRNIELMSLAGYPTLALDMADASSAVALLTTTWRQLANGPSMDVTAALPLDKSNNSRADLHFARNLLPQNISADGEWIIPIQLDSMPYGLWPDAFELNMIASPSSDGLAPVASVLLNDNLLSASLLDTSGEMTRFTARIPMYALRANNVLKVLVSRRVESGACTTKTQTLPVQLMPSSFMSLRKAPEATQFFMLAQVLSKNSEIVIPDRYLKNATQTLSTVSSVLAGLSMNSANFNLRPVGSKTFSPERPFVAFESEPAGSQGLADTSKGRLLVRDGNGETLFNSAGMGNLAVMQLVSSPRLPGVYVVTASGIWPEFKQVPVLDTGSLAVADGLGVQYVANLNDPYNHVQLDEQNSSLIIFFNHYRNWFIVLGFLLLPMLLIVGLRYYYRRKNLKA